MSSSSQSHSRKKVGLANIFTYFRMVSLVFIVGLWFHDEQWSYITSTLLFILAGITDLIDGHIARSRNETSPFGALIDLIADKMLVGAGLILIVQYYASQTSWVAVFAVVMILRELAMSSMREWVRTYSSTPVLTVTFAGKAKTAVQIFAISTLMVVVWPVVQEIRPLFLFGYWMGFLALFVGAILAITSLIQYSMTCIEYFKSVDLEIEAAQQAAQKPPSGPVQNPNQASQSKPNPKSKSISNRNSATSKGSKTSK